MGEWDEGTGEPEDGEDPWPQPCLCLHRKGCPERGGHVQVNWQRVLGLPSGTSGPWVYRSEEMPGEGRCEMCAHQPGCPRDDEIVVAS